MLALAALLAASADPEPGRADTLETLVMPGPVARAHADLETECAKCHRAFAAEEQTALCLDCHDEVAADRREKRGHHGRSPAASRGECRTCHPEHRGRDGALVQLDRAAFAHDATDAPLRGAHASVACAQCHEAGRPWRDASSACADCHAKHDPHAGRMGRDCSGCHDESRWSAARFDHATTRYPLAGAHTKVACATCHPGERWSGTPRDCASCHALQDVHRGGMGNACEDCHDETRWATARFDHGKTRFPLAGRHRAAGCASCHPGGDATREVSTACVSCHRAEDVHEGRNGPRCETCHGATGWKPASFDHDRATKFPLRGAHRQAACETCHVRPVHEQALEQSCISCHRDDDRHRGQQGEDCGRCHQESGWKERVAFDHDLARFPLLGLHAAAPCEACHASAEFRSTPRACAECHLGDDRHESRLGPRCESCHTANGWAIWRFDHDARTTFALHGAHAETACESCHREPVRERPTLAASCVSCHASDDPHRARFGTRCEDCHVDTAWDELVIQR